MKREMNYRTIIDVKIELQEIATMIKIFETKVKDYEQHPKYKMLLDKQMALFEEFATLNSLENRSKQLLLQGAGQCQ